MKKRWLVYALLLLLSVGLFGCAGGGATTVPLPPSDALCGSYIAGVADAQRLFSVDASQAFYYADQKNGRFVRGRVAPQGEGTYVVACQDPHNAGILPRQELLYDGNGFSLTIEGERHSFQKIDDVPAVTGDPSYYS